MQSSGSVGLLKKNKLNIKKLDKTGKTIEANKR